MRTKKSYQTLTKNHFHNLNAIVKKDTVIVQQIWFNLMLFNTRGIVFLKTHGSLFHSADRKCSNSHRMHLK